MRDGSLKQARILVVDDEPQNVRYIQDVLGWAGYENVEGLSEPKQALARVRQFDPDLIILDLLMPEKNGFELMDELAAWLSDDTFVPILVLTSDITREARRKALSAGARDFLTKPMSPTEVRIRVGNLLETRFLHLRCRRLERLMEELRPSPDSDEDGREAELLERWSETLDALTGAPPGHARRVAHTVDRLTVHLGMSQAEATLLSRAALLHDLGGDSLEDLGGDAGTEPIDRRGNGAGASRTSVSEKNLAEALRGSSHPVLQLAEELARHRRERWDGTGPGGLAGEAIPFGARVVAVAEELDHMRHGPEGHSREETAERIQRESGRRFDPRVVDAAVGAPSGTGT